MYQFVQQQADLFLINLLCEVIGMSRSAYYSYASGQSNKPAKAKEDTTALVLETFQSHKRRYGSRRLVEAAARRSYHQSIFGCQSTV